MAVVSKDGHISVHNLVSVSQLRVGEIYRTYFDVNILVLRDHEF